MKKHSYIFVILTVLLLCPLPAFGQGAGALAALHETTTTADVSTVVAPSTGDVLTTSDGGTATPADSEAQDGGSVAPSDAVVSDAGDAGEEPEPTVGDIVSGAGGVYDIWKTQGWIAGLTALIYLLVQITKLGFIKGLLGVRKWLRPLIALVLGLAGATFAAMSGGVVWWNALLGGIGAALGSSGFNELMNTVTAEGRAKSTGTTPTK